MANLPEPLPDDPLPLVRQWLADAEALAAARNPSAMALATSDGRGRPSVRMVLLRGLSAEDGYGVFYTHRHSRKGRELAAEPRAAGALYWEPLGRQLRLEGPVVPSPEAESDAYFATRPLGSQVNAWISAQSAPLESLEELRARADRKKRDLAASAPLARPHAWGGYRLWFDGIEFWVEGADRCHERVRYERTLTSAGAGASAAAFIGGPWRRERLQP